MSSEDRPPTPDWLQSDLDALSAQGYLVHDTSALTESHREQIDAVGEQFFELYLANPTEAIEHYDDSLRQYTVINNRPEFKTGLLANTTVAQFGLLTNIMSMRYAEEEPSTQDAIISRITNFLYQRGSENIGAYTAQIRNPELLQDLVGQDSLLWPHQRSHADFASKTTWEGVEAAMQDPRNIPIMIALAIPLATTPKETREKFEAAFPDLVEDVVGIVAALLYSEGARSELAAETFPNTPGNGPWEDAIQEILNDYTEEIRPRILKRFVDTKPRTVADEKVGLPGVREKVQATDFLLSDDGKPVRFTS